MYKVVFIDMDGTLLRKDHTISEVTQAKIRQLLGQGILIIPVSARPLHGILPITASVIDDRMPVVSLNGSYIYYHQEVMRQIFIPLPETGRLHEGISRFEVTPMYYSQMNWYTTVDNELVRKEQRITEVPIKVQPFDQIMAEWETRQFGPNKILVAGQPEQIREVESSLIGSFGSEMNIYTSQPGYLEIMDKAASKKTAIAFLLEYFGISREASIAIGDNFNDKEMIEYAGTGVAMGNAPAEIRAIADYVTDTNMQDGVARALDHFFP